MIYEETYRYLLRNVNSTEFDTCLYSVLHMDWDGVIQSPIHQMAKGIGTTEKYLKKNHQETIIATARLRT